MWIAKKANTGKKGQFLFKSSKKHANIMAVPRLPFGIQSDFLDLLLHGSLSIAAFGLEKGLDFIGHFFISKVFGDMLAKLGQKMASFVSILDDCIVGLEELPG